MFKALVPTSYLCKIFPKSELNEKIMFYFQFTIKSTFFLQNLQRTQGRGPFSTFSKEPFIHLIPDTSTLIPMHCAITFGILAIIAFVVSGAPCTLRCDGTDDTSALQQALKMRSREHTRKRDLPDASPYHSEPYNT